MITYDVSKGNSIRVKTKERPAKQSIATDDTRFPKKTNGSRAWKVRLSEK